MRTNAFGPLAGLLLIVALQAPLLVAQPQPGITIRTLSTRPDRVSDGNVLVEVAMPVSGGTVLPPVTLNGRDVSGSFRRGQSDSAVVALISGLAPGKNVLAVEGAPFGFPTATLTLTNYPRTGPITSGPHSEPFVCQTNEFTLPDGTTLGPPLDAHCSAATRVQHLYLPSNGKELRPLRAGTPLPRDVARTTTLSGASVPFVVRVETGTMNRGIFQQVVLHDPSSEPAPTPFTPPRGWNRRLVAVHGVGCPTGWYRQGGVQGVNLFTGELLRRLGEGYAVFTNTLSHPTNSCNAVLAGETTMMGKEHVIETLGVPFATISTGRSGGAYTSLQLADAYPGLFDGVIFSLTFPDALSIALAGLDGRLLARYFQDAAAGLSEEQQVAVSGYSSVKAMIDAANQAQRTDPVPGRADVPGYTSAMWHDAVPQSVRYHPADNPRGARPTVFDAVRNVYGVDRKTGFALRPFDNVGVQYGLGALNDKAITPAQFLDLNERIGGYDHDAGFVAARSVGDVGAITRAHKAGLSLTGGGGLTSIPVFDVGGYNEADRYHYQWFHFAVRERMRHANRTADNHLMWRGQPPFDQAWAMIEKWVTAVKSDTSSSAAPEKVRTHRPADAVDGCWKETSQEGRPELIREPQTFSRAPDSACNSAFPSYAFARHVAGGPLRANVLKCTLKPVSLKDYRVAFTPAEARRLRRVFAAGVCDWSKPDVGAAKVVPWASFGPAPENLVFDVTKP